jgi:hypothetical protein
LNQADKGFGASRQPSANHTPLKPLCFLGFSGMNA